MDMNSAVTVNDSSVASDYGSDGEEPAPADSLRRLTQMAVTMGKLELEIEDLTQQLKERKAEYDKYAQGLVPELMIEIGAASHTTLGGIQVDLKEEVRASLPKDPTLRQEAFDYLTRNGDDGLIRREISINLGPESTSTEEFIFTFLEQTGIINTAKVTKETTINNAQMVAYLRKQRLDDVDLPLKAFGAFVQRIAKIKRK